MNWMEWKKSVIRLIYQFLWWKCEDNMNEREMKKKHHCVYVFVHGTCVLFRLLMFIGSRVGKKETLVSAHGIIDWSVVIFGWDSILIKVFFCYSFRPHSSLRYINTCTKVRMYNLSQTILWTYITALRSFQRNTQWFYYDMKLAFDEYIPEQVVILRLIILKLKFFSICRGICLSLGKSVKNEA